MISLLVIVILYITSRMGVSILFTSIPIMLLAYAGSIKFSAHNEMIRFDDMKMTVAMVVSFLVFKFSAIHIQVIIVVVLFCMVLEKDRAGMGITPIPIVLFWLIISFELPLVYGFLQVIVRFRFSVGQVKSYFGQVHYPFQ